MSNQADILPASRPNATNDDYLFLSYNSLDHKLIQNIQVALHGRGITTFLDREQLMPGMPWFDALEKGVNNACAVAVFIGKEGLGTWQKREMELALDRQAKKEKSGGSFPVVPVVLPQADLERAPGFLLLNTWIDLRSGIDNASALDALARMVRAETDSQLLTTHIALCPYRALLAFREEDAPLFYGRETFANELLKKTLTHQLVAVVGPSGSGKSSVVQAGLLPLLRREHVPIWDTAIFTPGKHPFHNLAATLVSSWETELDKTQVLIRAGELGEQWKSGVPLETAIKQALNENPETGQLLLVVDQFEELFTLTPEAERLLFVNALFEATVAAPITILLTLRADFYSQAISLSRALSDRVQQGLINIGPMRREELRRAVENPAKSVGLEFEPGLVNRILDHVENQPGNLPLLEFALTELWKRRKGNLLTNAQYDEIGEVDGAISQRAEELFENLSKQEKEIALQLLTRLVRVAAPQEEGTDTRQRVNISELDSTMRSVSQQFVQARLLVVDRDPVTNEETIEVAHEALIRRWNRLYELLNQDREFMFWRRRFRLRLIERQHAEEDDEALLQGAALAEAKHWLKEREKDLIEDEKEYIRNSSRLDPKSDMWRGRIDMLNYVMLTVGATISFAFTSAENPHFIIFISALIITLFMFLEVKSYRIWGKALAGDIRVPANSLSGWAATGSRLRRNYLLLYTLLAMMWVTKVYLHPFPARDFSMFVARAGIGLISGGAVILSFGIGYIGLLVLALTTILFTAGAKEDKQTLVRMIGLAEEKTIAKQWLNTLNYVLLSIAATTYVAFISAENPHFVILINSVTVAFFCFKEASAYRTWAKYTLSVWEAIGLRLYRNYLWSYALLAGTWVIKVYLHPFPARTFDMFVARASIGLLAGEAIILLGVVIYVGLLIFALVASHSRKGIKENEEVLLRDITLAEAKQWLDTTSTYALAIVGATIYFALSSAESPHFVILINSVTVAFFCFRVASAYRTWAKALAGDLTASTYTMSGWEAVGLRLRFTYLFIYVLLAMMWVTKVYLHPFPARDFSMFVARAGISLISGGAVILLGVIIYAGLLAFVLTPSRFRVFKKMHEK